MSKSRIKKIFNQAIINRIRKNPKYDKYGHPCLENLSKKQLLEIEEGLNTPLIASFFDI